MYSKHKNIFLNSQHIQIAVKKTIFKEGDKVEGVYYIKKGRVKATKRAKNNIALWIANENEYIGLYSFFNSCEYFNYSSYAFGSDVEVYFITNQEFDNLINSSPILKKQIIDILCNRINATQERLSAIKSHSIKQRFLETIFLLSENKRVRKNRITIKYTLDELSELTCTSKQYTKKLIKEFHKTRLIDLLRTQSLVINAKKLAMKKGERTN